MSIDNKKISRIYQQGHKPQPPEHLDKMIIDAAHDAVAKSAGDSIREAKVKSPFSGGWPATMSIAAVLLVSFILVPVVYMESPTETSSSAPEVLPEIIMADKEMQQPMRDHERVKAESLVGSMSEAKLVQKRSMRSSPAKPMRLMSAPAPQVSASSVSSLRPMASSSVSYSNGTALTEMDYTTNIPAEEQMLLPDDWMKKIKNLIEKNQYDKARQELALYKKAYPGETVDIVIIRRLGEPD